MAATQTLLPQTTISIEEYLNTSFHPDVDFVDGHIEHRRPPEGDYTEKEIEELFVGEWEHNQLQFVLGLWFGPRRSLWDLRCSLEQRIHVSPKHIRVCDFCLLRGDAPRERVLRTPPLLCIEILSPEDRLSRAKAFLEDYRLMGVPNIWLLDPIRRITRTYDANGLHDASNERLEIPGSPIYILPADLFSQID